MTQYISIRTALSSLVLGCLGFVWGCDRTDDLGERDEAISTEQPTTEDVAENPNLFLNRQLTLVGEVDDIETPRSFELEGNRELFDNDELLVLTRSPVRFGSDVLEEGDNVMVTGTVRQFVAAEIERDLQWDLSTELETEWRTKNVFIATAVSKVDEYARWEETGEPEGMHVGLLSIYLAPDPSAFIGESISVEGVHVQSVTGKGIWLGGTHRSQVLVVPKEGEQPPNVQPGDWVDVRGTVRDMPPTEEVTKMLEAGDQSQHLQQQLQEEPIYIEATSIKQNNNAKKRADARKVEFSKASEKPEQHIGKSIAGEADVGEVITGRAFWLQNDDSKQRVLGVMLDEPKGGSSNVTPGQRVKFTALAMAPKDVSDDNVGNLEPAAKKAMQGQAVVFAIRSTDMQLINEEPGGTQPGGIQQQPGTSQQNTGSPGDRPEQQQGDPTRNPIGEQNRPGSGPNNSGRAPAQNQGPTQRMDQSGAPSPLPGQTQPGSNVRPPPGEPTRP